MDSTLPLGSGPVRAAPAAPAASGASGASARPRRPIEWASVASLLLIGAFLLDWISGNEISASLFYLFGIAVAAWFVGQRTGLVLAFLSALAWVVSVQVVGPAFPRASVLYWNLGVELVIYLTTAVVLAQIQVRIRREHQLTEQITLVKDALERETRAVGDLQREMLPPGFPSVPGYEWQICYATSTQAGGDYYDFFALPDGRIGVLLGDASGHGAQAAVLVAMMRVLLHTTGEALTAPALVLSRLGQQIAKTVPAGRFATACYAVLEPASGCMDFSLAGHPPPLILRADNGALEALPLRGGPPLGLFPGRHFEAGATTIRSGDTLVFYTDGLTEGMSPAHQLFGEVRLADALRGAGSLPLVQLRDRVLARLDAHRAGAALEDDLTLLLLRRLECPADRQLGPDVQAHDPQHAES